MAHQGRGLFRVAVVAVASLAVLLAAVPSDAAGTRVIVARLAGFQETPPEATAATGDAVMIFDTATNQINWLITHNVANATVAHFHGNGFPGIAAPILIDIGALSGGVTSPMVGSTTLTPTQASDLLAGRWYVNIHSTTFPGGEIRGQLASVGDVPLALFPGTSRFARTTGFDLTLFLNAAGTTPVGGSVKLNGADVTPSFLACAHAGTRTDGGQTFRCPVPGGVLATGDTNFLSVIVNLSDGSSVGSTATWSVDNNTEP
jgi:hypothetical protein